VTERNHRKYELLDEHGNIIRKGITRRPLEEREAELRRTENNPKARIRQVGRATTPEAAREWERKQRTGTPPGGRRSPTT